MRLKNIEMQGFKSFADKIYLDFNSGITAIVGPNGSGKSNISDAIRWVMGEQSIKSLRGSKMEDVIFAGTEARKALGFAEVTLILDNTDGYFDLDFPEVKVTRRIYRSGEGEYYINKTQCRLKDIHELFMDTGLGRDGYSIIGQGKIDNILSTKSEDRRQIFEEAAGISKYKYRKLEAEKKLASTVENLTRVKDILSELESQIGPLEKQSEKARKYLLLRDEMRELDINVSIINVDKIKDDVKKLSYDYNILNDQIKEISSKISGVEADISSLYDEIQKIDNETEKLSSDERDISLKISEGEKNIGILKNDTEHNIENIERLNIEIENALSGIKLFETELDANKSKLDTLNSELISINSEIEEASKLSEKAGENVGEKSDALDNLKSRIIDIVSELNTLNGAVENLKILSDSFEKRKSDILSEFDIKTQEKNLLSQSLSQAESLEKSLMEKSENDEIEIRKLENSISSEQEKVDKLNFNRNNGLLELSQKRSKRTMLMDMERELDGYAKGVKSVMNAFNDGKLNCNGIFGPLAQLIKTDKKYILAIETALGNAGQNIVVKSEDEAKTAIRYLKENNMGRATFLPISAIKGKIGDFKIAETCKGYISPASDLIDCDSEYKEIIENLLGTTAVCDNLDNAVIMARKTSHKFKIVTLSGDVILTGGAMTGGNAVKSTGSLSRTGEIDSLGKDIEALKKKTDEYEKNLKESTDILSKLSNDLKQKRIEAQKSKEEYLKAQADRERYAALSKNSDSSVSQLEAELNEIKANLNNIKSENDEKIALIEQRQSERIQIEHDATKAQEEFSLLSGESDRLSVKLTELNIKKATILKDIELINEKISSINNGKSEQLDSVNIKRESIEAIKNRNIEITAQIENIKNENEVLCQTINENRVNSGKLVEERKEKEQKIRTLQGSIKDVQEDKFNLSQKAIKAENKIDKLNLEREEIIERIWEDYELTYSDAVEYKKDEDFDYDEASKKIKDIKNQIKNLGNINIDSIEEYKNVKERFDFLTEQTDDLLKAKKELDSVISEMMEIMQIRFAEQFAVINQNFNKVFSELFGGGKANLTLSEPDNVLESGIEIEAQPPGKKLQSLLLLSGGERAFTAIALLFAILDVRPTPFCILDEIEAALDDVNVYRYADYLKKYCKKTQFIVVTHRRGTMEAANILYGVTMQEKGVSKLLSLNIDEVKDIK